MKNVVLMTNQTKEDLIVLHLGVTSEFSNNKPGRGGDRRDVSASPRLAQRLEFAENWSSESFLRVKFGYHSIWNRKMEIDHVNNDWETWNWHKLIQYGKSTSQSRKGFFP